MSCVGGGIVWDDLAQDRRLVQVGLALIGSEAGVLDFLRWYWSPLPHVNSLQISKMKISRICPVIRRAR